MRRYAQNPDASLIKPVIPRGISLRLVAKPMRLAIDLDGKLERWAEEVEEWVPAGW